ncbi:hypothetical protein J8F10_06595 [Gemmata sp. G18]|uniref:DUF2188 domain-containing protein n=1 Tax=Gemmata palustris TaxID=2822762 RepID=A0ABS5BMP1_9BACT|nr:hypothetical protein [Gemmata palustris]MBP3954949.1 hypothetical protein [Gemmata palustris]
MTRRIPPPRSTRGTDVVRWRRWLRRSFMVRIQDGRGRMSVSPAEAERIITRAARRYTIHFDDGDFLAVPTNWPNP